MPSAANFYGPGRMTPFGASAWLLGQPRIPPEGPKRTRYPGSKADWHCASDKMALAATHEYAAGLVTATHQGDTGGLHTAHSSKHPPSPSSAMGGAPVSGQGDGCKEAPFRT